MDCVNHASDRESAGDGDSSVILKNRDMMEAWHSTKYDITAVAECHQAHHLLLALILHLLEMQAQYTDRPRTLFPQSIIYGS